MANVTLVDWFASSGLSLKLYAAGSPVVVSLQAEKITSDVAIDNLPRPYTNPAIYASVVINFAVAWPAGSTLTINNTTLTASSDPVRPDDFLAFSGLPADRAQSMQSLADTINHSFAFGNIMRASFATQTLTLNSIIPGAAGIIQASASVPNGIQSVYTASKINRATTLGGASYGHYLTIQMIDPAQPSTGIHYVATVDGTPDAAGLTQIDISEYLRPWLRAPLPMPMQSAPGYLTYSGASAQFFMQYGEQYTGGVDGTNAQARNLRRYQVGSAYGLCISGALPSEIGGDGIDAYSVNPNPFRLARELTKAPPYRIMRRGDGEYDMASLINAYSISRDSQLARFVPNKMEVLYTFSDGLELEREYPLSTLGDINEGVPLADMTVHLNLNAQALKLDEVEAEIGRRVITVRVDVFGVQGANNPKIATITRTVDEVDTPQNYIPILFRNSFGFWELLHFEGVRDTDIRTTRTTYEQSRGYTYPDASRQVMRTLQVGVEERHTLRSGYLPIDHVEWLKDIAASPEVYTLTEVTGTPEWAPLHVTESTLTYSTEDTQVQLELRATWSQKENTLKG